MQRVPFARDWKIHRRIFGIRALPYLLLGRAMPIQWLARIQPPGAKRPVRLRLGSSDVWVFWGVFFRNHHAVKLDPAPRVVVDVGANVGLTTIDFARRFRKARVLAVEPEAKNFALLEKNVRRYRRIEPVHAALWSANEPVAFSNGDAEFDSFRFGRSEADRSDSVRGVTLDRLMDEHGLERIDLLKIDIEGAERQVFADPSAWIDRVDVMIIELHDFLMPGCESVVLPALKDFGFQRRRRIHVLAARDPSRLAKIPYPYRQPGDESPSPVQDRE